MYLRIPRIFFFLLTLCLCIVEVALAAWSVARAHDLQHEVTRQTAGAAELHVTDAIAVGGAVTAASACSAFLCLALLFFTIFRPHQKETLKTARIKEGIFAFILIFFIATLIPATYYTATRGGVITSDTLPQVVIDALVRASGHNPAYNKNTPIISYLIVGWIAFLSTAISLVLVSIAARKTIKYGPDVDGPLDADHHHHHGATTAHTGSIDESRPSMAGTTEKGPLTPVTGNTSAERMA
ncbi:hypothetical protein JCM6882_000978 [Rhodosporidiobolus microsporus]